MDPTTLGSYLKRGGKYRTRSLHGVTKKLPQRTGTEENCVRRSELKKDRGKCGMK